MLNKMMTFLKNKNKSYCPKLLNGNALYIVTSTNFYHISGSILMVGKHSFYVNLFLLSSTNNKNSQL